MEGFSQFRIDPILPEDKGAYTVFAWNQFGKAVNTGLIKVQRQGSDEVSHMKGALGARVHMWVYTTLRSVLFPPVKKKMHFIHAYYFRLLSYP